MAGDGMNSSVRYQVDEKPPLLLSVGLGLQLSVLCVAGVVLGPAIVVRAAKGGEPYLLWAVFAAVAVSGITTIIQAVRFGRIGAGYVLLMGTSGAFFAVSIAAIVKGGPAMLATLVIVSALFQFALAAKLSVFRWILTPEVAGTVIMLIPVTVMPIVFDLLKDVPPGTTGPGPILCALVTIGVMSGIALKATGMLRLWGPVIGVAAGSVLSGFFGLYDLERIAQASWIGIPQIGWPGFDLEFGQVFWALLPAFVFVTLVGAIETIGDSVAIQRVSWRRPRATDYRAVQGAVSADGLGNLLSGLMGTVPNTTYSTTISVTELTGVAARSVGIAIGVIFVVFAFVPKGLAVILAIPGPVVAAYATVLLALLFVLGMRIVVQDGIDYRKGLIVGVAFWLGAGFQNGVIFPEYFSKFAGGLLQNGMTAGALVAIVLTLSMTLTQPRSRKINVALQAASLPDLRKFLNEFAAKAGWGENMARRLEAATEETLLTLLQETGEEDARRLRLTARKEERSAILEFSAMASEQNLEDSILALGDQSVETRPEREVSLKLLQHFASSVRHQKYHDADVVTIRVMEG